MQIEDILPENDIERARIQIQEEIERTHTELKTTDKNACAFYIKESYIEGLQFALDLIGI